jgi:hypothetical protein
MVVTTSEPLSPPDRGIRWFLSNQTPWSRAVIVSGIAVLAFYIIGVISVLTSFGWSGTCPEGVTRLECSPSDPLAEGLKSDGLGLVARIALVIGLIIVAAAAVSWKRMPNKSSREAVISGGVLAIQAVALAALILWFRGTDIDRFARNFLNISLIGQKAGIAWDAVTDASGSIALLTLTWGAATATLVGIYAWLRKAGVRLVVYAGLLGAGGGLLWGLIRIASVPSFVKGAQNTLVLSSAGAVLGFALGLILARSTSTSSGALR